jgi:hypothetical protein
MKTAPMHVSTVRCCRVVGVNAAVPMLQVLFFFSFNLLEKKESSFHYCY